VIVWRGRAGTITFVSFVTALLLFVWGEQYWEIIFIAFVIALVATKN
jgi:hypothetical protein